MLRIPMLPAAPITRACIRAATRRGRPFGPLAAAYDSRYGFDVRYGPPFPGPDELDIAKRRLCTDRYQPY